jgi:hypothetical protein
MQASTRSRNKPMRQGRMQKNANLIGAAGVRAGKPAAIPGFMRSSGDCGRSCSRCKCSVYDYDGGATWRA